ncbi:hypothetical protein M413DRAFT_76500 [Hebeloma cylindrosporum]|uniref:INO80 complex subunit B-like conserved region domain-containing protein n=1 Tax=Hebeloma cylindrosporum TaxID=76867 RepID=A0A0C3C2Z8_HEBCY|nr:hypothetical protein M413DRAFT_76500 [Hebeloma cylindrosporum h7]
MAPRTRRSAAVAAAALVADMQIDSEEEEEQVDVEAEDDVDEGDEEEEEADVEDSQSEEERPVVATPTQPRLKITLRLPAHNASSAGTPTPDELEYAAFKRTPRRRAKIIQDVDIESEDPQSESEEGRYIPDVPPGVPSAGAKPMTTRQAVLASVVDPTHVSLDEGSRSKKQPLNATELALRREETARKRKNLSEKKLEDEKAETINRLLKKQSKPRNKRIDDRSPLPSASGSRTPKVKSNDADDVEGDEDEDDAMDVVDTPQEVKPHMYRWVSSLRGEEQNVEMAITFSVPENLVSPKPVAETTPAARPGAGPGICAIDGCGKPRKYRLPKDWTIGACDSTHLRLLSA